MRLDIDTWDALLRLSGQMQLPVSTMVREWLKERIAIENASIKVGGKSRFGKLDLIEKRLDALEKTVRRRPT
jgi:hypothetical protein